MYEPVCHSFYRVPHHSIVNVSSGVTVYANQLEVGSNPKPSFIAFIYEALHKQSYPTAIKNTLKVLHCLFMEYLCRSFQLASAQFLWLFYFSYPSPTRHVQYLAQAFYRFCLFRHDFKALVIKIFSHCRRFNCFLLFPVAYPIQSFLIFIICVCLIDPAVLRCYNQIQSIAHWSACRPLCESYRPSTMYSTCVGGGKHHPSLCFETIRPFLHASCSSQSLGAVGHAVHGMYEFFVWK